MGLNMKIPEEKVSVDPKAPAKKATLNPRPCQQHDWTPHKGYGKTPSAEVRQAGFQKQNVKGCL